MTDTVKNISSRVQSLQRDAAREVITDIFAEMLAKEMLKFRVAGMPDFQIRAALSQGMDEAESTGLIPDDEFEAFRHLLLETLAARLDEIWNRVVVPEQRYLR
jgi:hypothetical protein